MDSTNSWSDKYPYHIVEFVNRGRKPGVKKVDIVATKWIVVDRVKKKSSTLYPQPPYTSETFDNYNESLRMLSDINDLPDNWKLFTIKIRGKAETLDDALKKLKSLNDKESALTQESAESSSEVEKRAADKISQQQLLSAATNFQKTVSAVSYNAFNASNHQNAKTIHSNTKQKIGSSSVSRQTLNDITNAQNEEDSSSSEELFDQLEHTTHEIMQSVQSNIPVPTFSRVTKSANVLPDANISGTSKKDLSHKSHVSSVSKDLIQKSHRTLPPMRSGLSTCNKELESSDHSASMNAPKAQFNQVLLGYILNMMNSIKEIKDDIKVIRQDIENLKTGFIKGKNVVNEYISTVQQICDKFDYHIPFKTVAEFQKFDSNLKENEPLREAVTNVLQTGLDPTFVLSRSIVNMLKMFLSREVGIQYVAVKQIKNKYAMKPTAFFNCIEVLIKERRTISKIETSDKDLITALSNVLSNAGSWYITKKPDSQSSSDSIKSYSSSLSSRSKKIQESSSSEQPITRLIDANTPVLNDEGGQIIRVIAMESLERAPKRPCLQKNDADPLLSQQQSDESTLNYIDDLGPDLIYDNIQSTRTPSPYSSEENEFDEDYFLNFSNIKS